MGFGWATPMSIMASTGRAATQGVLFRDAAAIEAMKKVDTIIVDKTGTLTQGKPEFDRVPGFQDEEVLRMNQRDSPETRAGRGSGLPPSLTVFGDIFV
jgi:P-type E1-E2 ATPase